MESVILMYVQWAQFNSNWFLMILNKIKEWDIENLKVQIQEPT